VRTLVKNILVPEFLSLSLSSATFGMLGARAVYTWLAHGAGMAVRHGDSKISAFTSIHWVKE